MKEKIAPFFRFISLFALIMIVISACGPAPTTDSDVPTPIGGEGEPVEGEPTPVPEDLPSLYDGIVYVPGGRFMMGSSEEDPFAWEDEFPQHAVTLPGFWIFTREVTNLMYQGCVESGGCTPPENQEDGAAAFYTDPAYADHPVVGVSWLQAAEFCDAMEARLPTEAEWEKAARGVHGQFYPWGDADPECSLANIQGCSEEMLTGAVGLLSGGASPYGALDMAGNVAEWVFDYYDANFYSISPDIDPVGPSAGQYRVARGGGYTNPADLVRAAARFSFPPDEGFENVGFRCVPLQEEFVQAPFCSDTYIPFCEPTTNDGGDPGCQQGEQPNDGGSQDGGISVTGIGCPQGNSIQVYVEVGEGNEGSSVTINGNAYDCVPVSGVPGRLLCTGPAVASGAPMNITVCPSGTSAINTGNLACAPVAEPVLSPVNFNALLVSFMATVEPASQQLTIQTTPGNCPDGYVFNTQTGECEQTGDDNCPEGWSATAATAGCVPDLDGDCPEGTTFVAGAGCQPSNGECPEGYYFTANQSCEPDINRRVPACPQGYYFNDRSNCCMPIPGDNYGCESGYYYNANLGYCVPQTQDGCPYGYFYDPFTGCVPDLTQSNGQPPTYGQTGAPECPEGLVLNQAGTACVPPSGGTPNATTGYGACPPGYYRDNYQNCVPEDSYENPECGEGQYYDTYYQMCVNTGSDCPPGNYTNGYVQDCTPNTGQQSPCPPGYSVSRLANCCVPNPGTDGSNCPDGGTDGQTPTNQGTPNDPTGGYATPALLGSQDGYDPYGGYCDPVGDDPCPPGYFMNNDQVCEIIPDVPDQGCPEGTEEVMTQSVAAVVTICQPVQTGQCPEGYYLDTARNACLPIGGGQQTGPDCAENQYFDRQLGYCVQRNGDCCADGYYYDTQMRVCVPGPTQDGNTYCPPGQQPAGVTTAVATPTNCVPYGQTGEGSTGACTTIQTSMPRCDGPCLYPLAWDPQTQSCVQYVPATRSDPCNVWTTDWECNKNAPCSWNTVRNRCESP